jgi:precorrin-6B methylase 1
LTNINPFATLVLDTEVWAEPTSHQSPAPPGLASPPDPVNPLNYRCGAGCYSLWIEPKFGKTSYQIMDTAGVVVARATEGTTDEAAIPGSLVVVGLGIRSPAQTTEEVRRAIDRADLVFHLTDDQASHLTPGSLTSAIKLINRAAKIEPFYESEKQFASPEYNKTRIEEILDRIQAGSWVCIVTYGHPGVCYDVTHEMIRVARNAGLPALMLPAVSSLDCLFADLSFDPVAQGLQTFDASSFVRLKQSFDASSPLVLLQPSLLSRKDRGLLVGKLEGSFTKRHGCYLYRASASAEIPPELNRVTVAGLARKRIDPGLLLFIPARTGLKFKGRSSG